MSYDLSPYLPPRPYSILRPHSSLRPYSFLLLLLPSLPSQAIKARVREMEEEAERLRQMQSEVEKQMNLGAGGAAVAMLGAGGVIPTIQNSPPNVAAAAAAGFPTIEEKMEVCLC